jgi:hypothetical protein
MAQRIRRSALFFVVQVVAAIGWCALSAAPALSADLSTQPRLSVKTGYQTGYTRALPFPRSERAQSVWASGACWTECGSYCAWGMAGCLEVDAQGQCLKLTDDCDRYCQRQCRTSGGPWLPLDF